ncbi:hypothetical protein [Dongshaea marina]|uniref:hypothetical protein n=1 Tax=Dongshaea marina TaxID=2047966 RepID=UPI000D3E5915|nr:hypothetical protein [Dongshaea marina]
MSDAVLCILNDHAMAANKILMGYWEKLCEYARNNPSLRIHTVIFKGNIRDEKQYDANNARQELLPKLEGIDPSSITRIHYFGHGCLSKIKVKNKQNEVVEREGIFSSDVQGKIHHSFFIELLEYFKNTKLFIFESCNAAGAKIFPSSENTEQINKRKERAITDARYVLKQQKQREVIYKWYQGGIKASEKSGLKVKTKYNDKSDKYAPIKLSGSILDRLAFAASVRFPHRHIEFYGPGAPNTPQNWLYSPRDRIFETQKDPAKVNMLEMSQGEWANTGLCVAPRKGSEQEEQEENKKREDGHFYSKRTAYYGYCLYGRHNKCVDGRSFNVIESLLEDESQSSQELRLEVIHVIEFLKEHASQSDVQKHQLDNIKNEIESSRVIPEPLIAQRVEEIIVISSQSKFLSPIISMLAALREPECSNTDHIKCLINTRGCRHERTSLSTIYSFIINLELHNEEPSPPTP